MNLNQQQKHNQRLHKKECMKKFTPNIQMIPSIKGLISKHLYSEALKTSISLQSTSLLTDQIYAVFVKSGNVLHTFLATSLISHFSKLGDFHRSRRFLFDTVRPDTFAFNALLSGYALFRRNCFQLYSIMLSDFRVSPDIYTLSSLIKSCDCFDEVRVSHVICVKLGFNFRGFIVSGLVNKYAKLGFVTSAEKCFEECFDVDSVVFTSMINAYVWSFDFEKGIDVFRRMRKLGFESNEFSLTAVVGALSEVNDGRIIHGFARKLGLVCDGSLHLSNVIMNMYARCGFKVDARKVFDEIRWPDVVSWTTRIGVALDSGEALEIFKSMRASGIEGNELTIVNVLSAIEGPKVLVGARQVHSLCHKGGFLSATSVCNALISMYGKSGVMDEARIVFDEMDFRDCISWNSLIGGYSENGLLSSVLTVLSQMRVSSIQPDQYTLASVLGAVEGTDFTVLVMQIHSYLIKTGLISDSSMLSCLISSYGKCYSLDCAKTVLSEAQEISVGLLKVMAATSITAGSPTDALELFTSAMVSRSEMDGDILSIVLKACSALTNLGQGKAIHSFALKSGHVSDMFVETALVDLYCKCGCISEARNLFLDISNHNVAAWNAMIMGFAQHGRYNEVHALFVKMTELGIKPDEITYLGILQSCCHAGLADEAQFHLNSMYELHGLVPCLEHYASVVDLLGRVGLVKEAKLVIEHMPLRPDAHVWQSLLSACNNSGDLEIGEIATKELLKLQPDSDSAYILLSNLYAKAHDWDTVRKLRREMKEKLIYKEPGSSWTEIGGSVSHFLAEDISHPESEKIYFYLQTLSELMPPPLEEEEDCFACVDCM